MSQSFNLLPLTSTEKSFYRQSKPNFCSTYGDLYRNFPQSTQKTPEQSPNISKSRKEESFHQYSQQSSFISKVRIQLSNSNLQYIENPRKSGIGYLTQRKNPAYTPPRSPFDTSFKDIEEAFPNFLTNEAKQKQDLPFDIMFADAVPAKYVGDLSYKGGQIEDNFQGRQSHNELNIGDFMSPRDSQTKMMQVEFSEFDLDEQIQSLSAQIEEYIKIYQDTNL